ncbi:MAG: quinone-dependent dihydroorotate dehydrogenase [Elusimicrobia bacterium]|nr:quinone-dependent dihydroorotate dehydrogenase [Elusimicrobiota bacterium]
MLIDAETAHHAALNFLRAIQGFPPALGLARLCYRQKPEKELAVKLAGLEFPNPVGLAAGWDKDALASEALSAFGFGFLELGTVTRWPEKGHPRPRIFRSFKDQWIVNRVGFANDGAEAVAGRLKRIDPKGKTVVGLSVGKMLASHPKRLIPEAVSIMEMCYSYVSFFSLNVSSPNTPQGFKMGGRGFLEESLRELSAQNQHIAQRLGQSPKPLFVKISPTVSLAEVDELARVIRGSGVSGVIAANSMATPRGGLSGLPLQLIALKMTARLRSRLAGSVPIIGVGGILTPRDAWQRVLAGADLIQIFSGFVFRGPGFVRQILSYCLDQMHKEGFSNISQACGAKADYYAR